MVDVLETPSARASAKHLHVSPSKVRQVLALIRGLAAEDAERVLQLCQKDAAGDVLKVLDAAVANAEHNSSLPMDELYIARAYADEGPTRKWGQPRARGRYFRVRHRTTHLTIVLARYDEDDLEEKRRREEAASTATRGRGATRRRAERVRRSRAAQRGEDHDHDHDHDHGDEHEHAEVEETEATASADVDAAETETAEAAAEPETTDGDGDGAETPDTEDAQDEEEGE
jgi:large subunit ribosomal protein L22